jgi:hypothetical protein
MGFTAPSSVLTVESTQPVGFVAELLGKHLDGDVAIEPSLVGAVDLAHSPRAEKPADLVPIETVADRQRHLFSRCSRPVWQGHPAAATSGGWGILTPRGLRADEEKFKNFQKLI